MSADNYVGRPKNWCALHNVTDWKQ